MMTTYYYKHTAAPRALREYTDRRIAHELGRMRIPDARVHVTFDHEAESHCVKCELDDGSGIRAIASGVDPDVFAAVDEAVDRIIRQWARESHKMKVFRDHAAARQWPVALPVESELENDDDDIGDDVDDGKQTGESAWDQDGGRVNYVP